MTDRPQQALQMLGATDEELFFDISSSIFGKSMAPSSRAKLIERGRQWFELKRQDLAGIVCMNASVRRLAKQDVPTHELVVAICGALDLGVHVLGGAPVVTVAVLIVRLGLHEFCSAMWLRDSSQSER